jgi:hypothetical protein
MNEETCCELTADNAGLLELGVVLGQNHAFGLIAGRCSAAQADAIRHIREEKLFKKCTEKWDDFCPDYLKISRAEADRTIKLLDEFGPVYFEVAQLTRVSAQTFRAIAPAIHDGALHHNGEAIELNPENSRKVAAAVADLRRSIGSKPPELSRLMQEIREATDEQNLAIRIEKLNLCCRSLIEAFERIGADRDFHACRSLFGAVLAAARSELGRVAQQSENAAE